MVKTRQIRLLRLAMYDPFKSGKPKKWLGEAWEDGAYSYKFIRECIQRYDDKTLRCYKVILSLGVFDYGTATVVESPRFAPSRGPRKPPVTRTKPRKAVRR